MCPKCSSINLSGNHRQLKCGECGYGWSPAWNEEICSRAIAHTAQALQLAHTTVEKDLSELVKRNPDIIELAPETLALSKILTNFITHLKH